MKGYYDKALKDEDNKKVVIDSSNNEIKTDDVNNNTNKDEIILNKESVETQDFDYNFERYTDHKPEETQVYGGSLSKGAIIALISTMVCIIMTIVGVIVFKTINGTSKAASVENFDIVDESSDDQDFYNENGGEDSYSDEESGDMIDKENETGNINDNSNDNSDVEKSHLTGDKDVNYNNTNKNNLDATLVSKLKDLANNNSKASVLLENTNNYPVRLLEDVVRNPEMLDYTINYPNMINKAYTDIIDITNDAQNLTYGMPYFIQWDSRWGYYPYSSGVIGISGCGPTCLSMVYVHLTGDTVWNPLKMAKYSTENGYVTVGVGTSWSLMTTGAKNIGLQAEKISNNESIMISHLIQGHPLIASMGPGIFTDKGHFIVFRKYENGMFYVNDPFCIEHTNRAWSYSEFSKQIKSVWAYWR